MRGLQLVKRAAYRAAWGSGTLAALRWLRRDRAAILCYHSVVAGPLPDWTATSGGLHLPAEQFADQLEFLAQHYEVVSLQALVDDLAAGRRPPRRAVAITFDDGYANNLTVAAPLLAEFGFPATIFLATDYIGHGRELFWWDDVRARLVSHESLGCSPRVLETALRRADELLRAAPLEERAVLLDAWGPAPDRLDAFRPASWDQCRAAPPQIQFGGHSAAHRLLGEISPEDAREDLDRCQRALGRELPGRVVPLFCYPAGQSTPAVRTALGAAGFRAAVTAGATRGEQRLVTQADELTLLPRIGVTDRMTLPAFAARAAGV